MPAGIAQLTKLKNEIELFFLVKLSVFIAFAPYQKRATVARLALCTKHKVTCGQGQVAPATGGRPVKLLASKCHLYKNTGSLLFLSLG